MNDSGPQKNVRRPGVGERRVALHRGVEVGRHPVPVRRDGAEGEVGRRSVELPRRTHRLEQPDEQAAALLAVVGVAVRVLDHRQVAVHAVDGLGEQVVVLGGLQRDVDADAAPQLARPEARGDHDGLALDVACVGDDRGDPAVLGAQPGHRHALDDGDAARGGALGQRGRHTDRVGATFVGDVRRREDVVDRGDRRQLGHLGRGDLDVVDAEAALEGALAAQRLEPLRRGGEVQVADRAEPGGVAGLGLEAGVEVAGVARHPQRGLVDHAGAGDQSGRVPRGPGREVVPLDEDDVGDAERAEVVGDAAADHAPTDDDDAGPRRKVSHEPGPYPDRPFSPARPERLTRWHDAQERTVALASVLGRQRLAEQLGARSGQHVRLGDSGQGFGDAEQLPLEAMSDHSLELACVQLGREVNHRAQRRGAPQTVDRRIVGRFAGVIRVVHRAFWQLFCAGLAALLSILWSES